jgi:hypothetical protein
VNPPILRPLTDQLAARVAERNPLSLDELRDLARTIRVAANRYEPPADVLSFRPRTGGDAA